MDLGFNIGMSFFRRPFGTPMDIRATMIFGSLGRSYHASGGNTPEAPKRKFKQMRFTPEMQASKGCWTT